MEIDPDQDLKARLRQARAQMDKASGSDDAGGGTDMGNAMGLAFRIGIELVSALAVSVGLGYALDRWWHTSPLMLIVMFFLGAGAGIMNVYRAVNGLGAAPGYFGQRRKGGAKGGSSEGKQE